MNPEVPHRDARFATTHWSLVVAAGERDSPEGRAALEAICRDCWFPLYAFARRGGSRPEDAQDHVQGFFTALLQKDYLGQADRERGRFRTFLLAAFQHYVSNERAKAGTAKRGGGVKIHQLDLLASESRYTEEPADDRTPERVFERRWALALLERVLTELRASYGDGPRSAVFEALRPLLLGGAPFTVLGMSEGAARVALHRMRRRFRDLLRAAIADTVASPSEIDDEIRHLQSVLSG